MIDLVCVAASHQGGRAEHRECVFPRDPLVGGALRHWPLKDEIRG